MIINVTDGKTPYIGDNGTWWIGGTDTGVIAAGTDGIDGTTPHIGPNGNWFIGTEDTGTSAQGGGNTSIIPVALISSDWSTDNASQNISVSGILEDETKQIITIVPFDSSMELYETCEIECTAFGVDTLTFTAKTIPAEDISIYVILENVTGGNKVANNVYSTEEQVVGTWIDGKPIYRKTFIFNTSPTTESPFTDTGDFDYLTSIQGMVLVNSGAYVHIPVFESSSSRLLIELYKNDIYFFANGTFANRPVTCTIEYTKTTDAATIEIPSATALMDEYQKGVQES